jgi:hypothetical protein
MEYFPILLYKPNMAIFHNKCLLIIAIFPRIPYFKVCCIYVYERHWLSIFLSMNSLTDTSSSEDNDETYDTDTFFNPSDSTTFLTFPVDTP